jgi:DNA-binding transcriptional ArsR family regulator
MTAHSCILLRSRRRALARLRRAGLVKDERRGMHVFYSARRGALGALVRVMDPDCFAAQRG